MCEFWFAGERSEIHLSGDAWTELPIPLRLFKRAIAERNTPVNDEHADDAP